MTEPQLTYELWIARREMWMPVMMAIGFEFIGDVHSGEVQNSGDHQQLKPVGPSHRSCDRASSP
jgi:hypothetical protein